MSVAYEIERGHPIPVNATRGTVSPEVDAIRRLAAAAIGDSVFLPGVSTAKAAKKCATRVGPNWFSTRAAKGGCRVWKVAEVGQARPPAPTVYRPAVCRTPETCEALGCISGACK